MTPDDYGGELDPHGADLVRPSLILFNSFHSAIYQNLKILCYSAATLSAVSCTPTDSQVTVGTIIHSSK